MVETPIRDKKTLIVIPCLNEAANIEQILRQVCSDCESLDAIIAVVDGRSTDGTQDIVTRAMAEFSNLVLVDNPKRLQAAAVNLAVELYGGGCEYFIRIDAHGEYPNGFCRVLLQEVIDQQADSVVVGMKTSGFGLFQKATALAQNSKLGNGGSKHRGGGGGEWVVHGHHEVPPAKRTDFD